MTEATEKMQKKGIALKAKTEKALVGAGCFWGVEAAFRQLKGVTNVTVGYSGGTKANPSYENVCSGTTGHAETALVEFDPQKISYSEILGEFWRMHDPTQKNRQGPDVGHQYRSVIFYFSEEQKKLAGGSKQKLAQSKKFSKPIVTEIVAAGSFWPAESYHQRYLEKNGEAVC